MHSATMEKLFYLLLSGLCLPPNCCLSPLTKPTLLQGLFDLYPHKIWSLPMMVGDGINALGQADVGMVVVPLISLWMLLTLL